MTELYHYSLPLIPGLRYQLKRNWSILIFGPSIHLYAQCLSVPVLLASSGIPSYWYHLALKGKSSFCGAVSKLSGPDAWGGPLLSETLFLWTLPGTLASVTFLSWFLCVLLSQHDIEFLFPLFSSLLFSPRRSECFTSLVFSNFLSSIFISQLSSCWDQIRNTHNIKEGIGELVYLAHFSEVHFQMVPKQKYGRALWRKIHFIGRRTRAGSGTKEKGAGDQTDA